MASSSSAQKNPAATHTQQLTFSHLLSGTQRFHQGGVRDGTAVYLLGVDSNNNVVRVLTSSLLHGGCPIVIGDADTAATGTGSAAIGCGSTLHADHSVSLGSNTNCTVDNSVLLGEGATHTSGTGMFVVRVKGSDTNLFKTDFTVAVPGDGTEAIMGYLGPITIGAVTDYYIPVCQRVAP